MASQQDVVQLPYPMFDYTDPESMAIAIQRNFREVERYLALLQMYVKQATGGGVADLPGSADVWDRANNINPEGTISTDKLTDKMVGLEHALQLADEAVTEAKVATGAIKELHITAGAIPVVKTNFPYHQIY